MRYTVATIEWSKTWKRSKESLHVDFKVGSEDKVVQIHVASSNLGSLEAEVCMTQKIEKWTFERQGNGVAETGKDLKFEAPYDYPDPKSWKNAKVKRVLSKNRKDVESCLQGATGVTVTIYVGQGGVVLTSGAASEQVGNRESAACLAKAVRKWMFPNPGPDLAKVSLSF